MIKIDEIKKQLNDNIKIISIKSIGHHNYAIYNALKDIGKRINEEFININHNPGYNNDT